MQRSAFIHVTSEVEGLEQPQPPANRGMMAVTPENIGPGTYVWRHCHIRSQAIIGQNCTIGQNVYIANDVFIGDGCKIQNNVSLYDGVRLEGDVFVGPSAVFTNVINPRAFLERKEEFQKTIVRHGATIGANATIVCGVVIGEYAFVAAGATVTKHVPAYGIVAGCPAALIGITDKTGTNRVYGKRVMPWWKRWFCHARRIKRQWPS